MRRPKYIEIKLTDEFHIHSRTKNLTFNPGRRDVTLFSLSPRVLNYVGSNIWG